ncbi:MAG TPA: hypothetical protein VF615_24470 [Longimicrobiaceae bacterium]|jgi:uncharacterized repeat protein (TIGR01451 family)
MTPILRGLALAGLLLAPLAASPAAAQTPTAEGTTITNTATATWSDANGNTYTPATASVSITVGFAAGVDVASPTTATPLSPSTANEQPFTITNGGNGLDSVSVSTTAGAGVTVTGYKIGSTTYPTLAALNAALAGTPISAGGTVTVTVVYTVASGQSGQSIPLGLTATSRRTPANSDTSTTTLSPIAVAGISVTPDAGTVSRLPSNGTQYTATYTLTNPGGVGGTFNLAASTANGAVLTIVSVNGTAGASGSIAVGAGGTQTVDVVYTIATGAAAGSTAGLTLAATSSTDPSTTDTGSYTVTVIGASVSMSKEAFRDNQTTAIGAGDRVLPGEYIQYRITVTNTGASAASTVSVSDPLPAQVTYQSASGDAAGWTISESSGTVTAGLATLAPSASRFFWIRVRVK